MFDLSQLALTPDAIATFAALLCAHALGDYVFQTNHMATNKRKPHVFAAHVALHGALTLVLLGGTWQIALAIMLLHALIDATKIYVLPERYRDTLTTYLLDQAAHIATLFGAALIVPNALASGLWASTLGAALPLTQTHLLIAGFILATFAGGPAVGALMRPYTSREEDGVAGAGRLIGLLERAIIFILVFIGEPTGIGFLIAAKSILRFEAAKKDAEYIIIGTLASFGWALTLAMATHSGLALAPP